MHAETQVRANLLAQVISNTIQIFDFKKRHRAPFPDPFFVEFLVMKRKYRLDILPLPLLRNYTGTTLCCRIRYHMVDNAIPLGLSQWLVC